MAYVSGFGGDVEVGMTQYPVSEWSANLDAELLDVTTTGSAGYQDLITGTKSAEGTGKSFFAANQHPMGSLGIIPGAAATLTLNIGPTGLTVVLPVLFSQVSIDNPAKGVVGFSFSWKSNGPWTTIPS